MSQQQQPQLPFDLGNLGNLMTPAMLQMAGQAISNPEIMRMGMQMMSSPQMQQMIQQVVSNPSELFASLQKKQEENEPAKKETEPVLSTSSTKKEPTSSSSSIPDMSMSGEALKKAHPELKKVAD